MRSAVAFGSPLNEVGLSMDDPETTQQTLTTLYGRLRQEIQARFARDLPFEELLFDRWKRARQLGFGAGASIYHNGYVYDTVSVGANTWIGPFVLLDGSGRLTIGSTCSISAGVPCRPIGRVVIVESGEISFEYGRYLGERLANAEGSV